MNLVPHITFNGDCEEALKFYKNALNGEIEFFQRYADSPMADQVPNDWGQKLMHATFSAGEIKIIAADSMPGHERSIGGNIDLSIGLDSKEALTKAFTKMADGGEISFPLQDVFWGSHFGMLTDRFGIRWMFNFEYEEK